MTPSALQTTADTFDARMQLMDVVDTLRNTQLDTNALLNEEDNERALTAQVLATYEAQGMEVSEGMVRQALELHKSRRFEFEPPRDNLGLKLANAYITRDKWVPVLALRSAVTASVLAVVGMGWWGVGELRYQSWKSDAQQTIADETFVRQNQAQLTQRLQQLPTAPRTVLEIGQKARKELTESARLLALVPAVPTTVEALESLYERDTDAARTLVKARESQLVDASKHVGAAKKSLTSVQALQAAYQNLSAFDAQTPEYLENFRQQQRFAFQRAADEANTEAMEQAVNLFQQGLALNQQLEMLTSQAAAVAGGHLQQVTSQLEEVRNVLTTGNVAAAQTLLSDLSSKMEVLALSYTLRIVSEEGERSGVQRSFNNSDARSYYIIVDAIDSAGKPVKLPVTNVETKREEKVSRFGIRVPESVYNAVGKDKSDDGIVDKDTFGRKAAGELDPTYEFEALSGNITHW